MGEKIARTVDDGIIFRAMPQPPLDASLNLVELRLILGCECVSDPKRCPQGKILGPVGRKRYAHHPISKSIGTPTKIEAGARLTVLYATGEFAQHIGTEVFGYS